MRTALTDSISHAEVFAVISRLSWRCGSPARPRPATAAVAEDAAPLVTSWPRSARCRRIAAAVAAAAALRPQTYLGRIPGDPPPLWLR
eukprot:CAMPEP_0180415808 /NCGR_PEP_ID=MMETSP1036_2-20121128/127_1 /TAXON_ID=632150 /ORGANISM="Azadinium spinosum, Strain 3D9" /LENGTH=87 /DNA_ID=CAMNT_0022420655 /DNA_START=1233 /DNA_END=1494 /DNA_ORIENTATION=+